MSPLRRLLTVVAGSLMAAEIAGGLRRLQTEFRTWRMHRRGCARSQSLLAGAPLCLHLGCGGVYKPGWVNIDSYSIPPCTPDLLLDLRRPLPFPDGSCAAVYSEHFFEHLPFPEGALVNLRESLRVLIPGGEISIGVPDPRPILEAYLADTPLPYFEYFQNHFSVRRQLGTKMEAVNWLFRQGGEHHFIYDFPSLKRILEQAGFSSITRREYDSARDSAARRHDTIYVDARKAG